MTPWTVAHQALPSMGFSRQEYWSGLPFLSPGDLPDPGIEPGSPAFPADALTSEPPGEALVEKNPPANAGDEGLIPGSERHPARGNRNPFQYLCLQNSEEPGRLQSMGSHRVGHD